MIRYLGSNAKRAHPQRDARSGRASRCLSTYVCAKAGAKIQAVWDYKSSVFGHFALTPWNIPDNKYVDTVVALAQKGILFLWDLGYFKGNRSGIENLGL